MWPNGTTFGSGVDTLKPIKEDTIDVVEQKDEEVAEPLDFPEAALKAAGTAPVPDQSKITQTPVEAIKMPESIVFNPKEPIKTIEAAIDTDGKIIDINPAIENVNNLINKSEKIIQSLLEEQTNTQNEISKLNDKESIIVKELEKNRGILDGLNSTLVTLQAIKDYVETKPSLN